MKKNVYLAGMVTETLPGAIDPIVKVKFGQELTDPENCFVEIDLASNLKEMTILEATQVVKSLMNAIELATLIDDSFDATIDAAHDAAEQQFYTTYCGERSRF